MKKKIILGLLATGLVASVLAGCGAKEPAEQTAQVEQTVQAEQTGDDSEEDNYEPPTQDLGWIPAGVALLQSETTKDADIEKTIREFYEIPNDFLADTRYYYNLVDFNLDGKDEYFVVVFGSYVSGMGGGSALWLDEEKKVIQSFQSVNTPLIVEDQTQNGFRTLIMQLTNSGSESEYARLVNDGELYIRPEEGEMITDLGGVTGTAIISNDTIQEFYDGNYLSLE